MRVTLDEIVESQRAELATWPSALPTPKKADGRFLRALQGPGVRVIAELKPASPSAGVLREAFSLDAILPAYNQHAHAISVLTEPRYFNGSFERLADVSQQSPLPTLCKDFIVDVRQVLQARLHGAQAVLLIVKILDDASLATLHQAILDWGMIPVVEVQNREEVERAMAVSPQVVLINNRNLSTFEIDLNTTAQLAPRIDGPLVIAASGIETRADIERLLPFTQCFLIGSSLMRSPDPGALLGALTGALLQ
jgi:indole-3-glycerol phosphate synthase/phosphoribosylanthranilate isomerase